MDTDPAVARRITASLVGQLVDVTNQLRLGNLPDGLKSIDDQLTQLASRRAPIAAEAQANPRDAVAQNRLAGIDRLISDLSASRNELALAGATAGRASVIDPAAQPEQAEPARLAQVGFLAAVCAVVFGLLVIAVIETLRPHVSGLPRIGRLLQGPSLGRIAAAGHDPRLGPVVQRLRLAARRSGCTVVVAVPAGRVPHLDHLLGVLGGRLSAPGTAAVAGAAPAPEAGGAPATPPPPAAPEPADTGTPPKPQPARRTAPKAAPAQPSSPAGAPAAADPLAAGDVLLVAERASNGTAPATHGTGGVGLVRRPDRTDPAPTVRMVTTLDGLGPAEEGLPVGVLVLTTPVARRARLHEVRELLEITGWPLLGVAEVTRRRRFAGGR
jgi:hypothetical protein